MKFRSRQAQFGRTYERTNGRTQGYTDTKHTCEGYIELTVNRLNYYKTDKNRELQYNYIFYVNLSVILTVLSKR